MAEGRLAAPQRRIADLRLSVDDAWEPAPERLCGQAGDSPHRLAYAHTLLMHRTPATGIRERHLHVVRAERT